MDNPANQAKEVPSILVGSFGETGLAHNFSGVQLLILAAWLYPPKGVLVEEIEGRKGREVTEHGSSRREERESALCLLFYSRGKSKWRDEFLIGFLCEMGSHRKSFRSGTLSSNVNCLLVSPFSLRQSTWKTRMNAKRFPSTSSSSSSFLAFFQDHEKERRLSFPLLS